MSQGTYIRGSLYPRALYPMELISKGAFLTEIKKMHFETSYNGAD